MKFTSDVVIGLEIHAELATESKIFCGCPTHGDDDPNTRTCEVCLGLPGSKPVLNEKVLEYGIRLCLAAGSKISPELVFSRKSYFYPDLSKNYQITQYELPLGTGGEIEIEGGKKVGLIRIHLEEDPAALVHPGGMTGSSYVLVDYNRSGDPLVEVVTKPELASPEEARDFMKKLITILNYLGIFDVNRCVIKADANVSIKESGYVRAEVKNITGFKEIERALAYEVERQKREASELKPETRGWDSEKGMTFPLREKEAEEDYGYIIDPDLVPTEISKEMLDRIRQSMPELAHEKVKKFVSVHKISKEDAVVISQEKQLAELFEKVAEKIDPVLAARWLRRELLRVLNYNKKQLHQLKFDEKILIELLSMVENKDITETTAQQILEKLVEEPFSPKEYVEKEGLRAVSEEGELQSICEGVIKENPKAVEDVKAGVDKSLNFLVGQVMRKTRGTASPKEVNDILKKLLS